VVDLVGSEGRYRECARDDQRRGASQEFPAIDHGNAPSNHLSDIAGSIAQIVAASQPVARKVPAPFKGFSRPLVLPI
jgi:hypothetical protein